MIYTDTAPYFATPLRAKKNKPIRAMKMNIHPSIAPFLQLKTLEGNAEIGADNYICLGVVGEPWQQTSKKLKGAYNFSKPAPGGWEIWEPKPDAEVECFIADFDGYIQGTWGSTIDGVPNLQKVLVGDLVLRDPNNHIDQWRVAKDLFGATYGFIE